MDDGTAKSIFFKHPNHDCSLILRDFSENSGGRCDLCSSRMKGPGYECPSCSDSYLLHKLCAELPLEVRHPSHPQHSIRFTRRLVTSSTCKCGAGISKYDEVYRCESDGCDGAALHAECVVATLLLIPTSEDQEEEVRTTATNDRQPFFAHEHPLESLHLNLKPTSILCRVCQWYFSGCSAYGCRSCVYLVHESCARLPREITPQHPFHPQPHHPPLTLVPPDFEKQEFICKACKKSCVGQFGYHCDECDVVLDVGCAVSIVHPPPSPHSPPTDEDEGEEKVRLSALHHFSHPHPLSSCVAKAEVPIKCALCSERISGGDFHCCIDCPGFAIHASCPADDQSILKQETIHGHPLHPDHPLTWTWSTTYSTPDDSSSPQGLGGVKNKHECGFCSSSMDPHDPSPSPGGGGLLGAFGCEQCAFNLHPDCALLSSNAVRSGVALVLENFHAHPMRLFAFKPSEKEFSSCQACDDCFEHNELGYSCVDCKLVLHERCARRPYQQLEQHPFHPQHPLLLHPEQQENDVACGACLHKANFGHTYRCAHCEFQLHALCARDTRATTLKHPRHEHSLAHYSEMGPPDRLTCNLCYRNCRIDFYRCVACDYNLHHDCTPLPPSGRHEFHSHTLVLRDRVVDDNYDEQYCNVCEETRHPEHGVYYCDQGCGFTAHIECIYPNPNKADDEERRRFEKLNQEITSLKAQIEELKKELGKKQDRLEELENMMQAMKMRSRSLVHGG